MKAIKTKRYRGAITEIVAQHALVHGEDVTLGSPRGEEEGMFEGSTYRQFWRARRRMALERSARRNVVRLTLLMAARGFKYIGRCRPPLAAHAVALIRWDAT